MDPLLGVQGLSVSFGAQNHSVLALGNVSFDVERGATVALIGESGSGKTLAGLSLVGLLPPGGKVTAGTALFDGQDLLELSAASISELRGKRIATILQEDNLLPTFNIGWQVLQVLKANGGIAGSIARARLRELLELVGLPASIASFYPHQLSAGMQRLVAIAIAIAARPSLLIADEPVECLDAVSRESVLDLLRGLQLDTGLGILLISRDVALVRSFAQSVVVLHAGRVIDHPATESACMSTGCANPTQPAAEIGWRGHS